MEGNAAQPEEAASRPHSERRTCPAHDLEHFLPPSRKILLKMILGGFCADNNSFRFLKAAFFDQ
jgi:hypothetical protein